MGVMFDAAMACSYDDLRPATLMYDFCWKTGRSLDWKRGLLLEEDGDGFGSVLELETDAVGFGGERLEVEVDGLGLGSARLLLEEAVEL